jgi:hypothetical protein
MASTTRRIVTAGVAAIALVAGLAIAAPASAAAAVSVTSISPSSGPSTGGTRVTVNGTGFTHVTGVTFGSGVGSSIHLVSSTRLLITAPPHAIGPVDVQVHTSDHGTSLPHSVDHFRYRSAVPTVTSISPVTGPATGGTRVTLNGTNFTGTTRVFFGVNEGTALHYVGTNRVLITAPAGSAGTVDVRAVTAGGTSAATAADHFTYQSAELAPVTGLTAAGATVTSITLVWTPSASADVDGVTIRRAAGTTPPAGPTDGDAVADVGSGTAFYVDSGLTSGTTYSYAVFAHNAADTTSAAATVTTATQRAGAFGPFSATGGLTDISCPTSSTCVGVQGSSVNFFKTGSFMGPVVIAPGDTLTSISCVTTTNCVALGGLGAYIYNLTWSGPTQIGTGGYTAVSCVSTFCMAVNPSGSYATFNGTTWTTAAGPTNHIVSCATPTSCAGADVDGHATFWTGSTWTTLAKRAGSTPYVAIDCSSASFCELLDTSGGATALVSGALGTRFALGGFTGPQDISCFPNTTLCTAVDSQGRLAESNGEVWSAGTPVAASASTTTFTLDCTVDQFCMIVSGSGNAYEMVG